MQKKIFLIFSLVGIVFLLAFRYSKSAGKSIPKYISRNEVYKKKSIVQCSPDWNYLNSDSLAKSIQILQGWGNYQWNITSKSDSARLYFQQGINMYYSFHIIEAMASFKKAEQFDNSNPMIYWAQALAYGPNINDFAYAASMDAFAAAQKAATLSANCSAKEKALIKAMTVRYSTDSTVSRTYLNQLYTDEMQNCYTKFPVDADIAALYADAIMIQHPWEYWKHNGEAQPWTPLLLAVLENALQHSPQHPGANHYYIHSVEASGNPQRALPSANRLSSLMPSVSHMVHMPSHIYIRSGLYNEGVKVNEMSLKGYQDYLSVYPDVVNNAPLYLIHNLHMLTTCAMMGRGYAYTAKSADDCRASFDSSFMSLPAPFGGFIQYVYMTPMLNNIRFGKWEAVLQAPEIDINYVYANLLHHWAKGIALARTNKIVAAKQALLRVKENMNKPDMLVVMQPFNAPVAAATVAQKILEGIIAEQENDLPNAIRLFTEAVTAEDALVYNEPKDWLIPARHYLGAALLKSNDYLKAADVFKGDLKESPNNHWSLKGLYESLQKQRKFAEAKLVKNLLDKSISPKEMKELTVVF